MSATYHAIYDFELLPYALGDVLTWNVQTALHCQESGGDQVDINICLDRRFPASIYQRNLVVAENFNLYFNELFGAFCTDPLLGNVHVYGRREEMLAALRPQASENALSEEALADYERILSLRDQENSLNEYFIKYIYSHSELNRYGAEHGHIPLLKASRGCEPDIEGLLTKVFPGKRIVVVHPRLRRLDHGYGGDHTYFRDSDFLEWYEFLRTAVDTHPDVQIVVVGRLQEKPLALLRLPNVMSLRALGLGLGHELTLMLRADLFIGTSSGFAAMANFSEIPYFITRVNKELCNAYGIPQGSTRLPFAKSNQILTYEEETAGFLAGLLDAGLAAVPPRRGEAMARDQAVDVRGFAQQRNAWLHPAATTGRFFVDGAQSDQETAFLIWPKVQDGFEAIKRGDADKAQAIARRIDENFPGLRDKFPELAQLSAGQAPGPPRMAMDRLRRKLEDLDGKILPVAWRGSVVHAVARRLKSRVLGRRSR